MYHVKKFARTCITKLKKNFMKLYKSTFIFLITFLIAGCAGEEIQRIFDEGYTGHDDEPLEEVSTDEEFGAQEFVSCKTEIECGLLWDTAKEWLPKASESCGTLSVETETRLECATKSNADLGFIVQKFKNTDGGATIKIKETCNLKKFKKACPGDPIRDIYAFNVYLKDHLEAFRKGIITYEPQPKINSSSSSSSDALDISLDGNDIGNDPLNVEIIDGPETRYKKVIMESLVDEYSCNKESEILQIKKINKREIFEVNCIKEVKRMIFDCRPSGCEVLQ